ncbi:MAG: hypothetical protein VXV96_04675 [Bdellovibrionota bacterium]|nr:hypothetical protein [Bdellovibrionota bacterium]
MKALTLFFITLSLSSAACLGHGPHNEEVREAMEACHQELGTERPERGTRPSDEDRAKMEACLESKGFEKPERPSRRR